MRPLPTLLILLFVLAYRTNAESQTIPRRGLTLDGAKKVIGAAVAEAKKLNAPGGAIAVVDEGGNLIAVERLDGTFAAGAILTSLPVMGLFYVLQKYLVGGLTAGSVKG